MLKTQRGTQDLKISPDALRALSLRCRRTARVFWFDWRAQLAAAVDAAEARLSAGRQARGGRMAAEELLDGLQAAVCWRPAELSSSRLSLRFGEHFELAAAIRPGAAPADAVASVDLRSLLPLQPAALDVPQPHLVLLAALFPAVQARLSPALAACGSAAALRALLADATVQLGRLLELADERVVLAVAPMPQGGAALTLRLSYMHARARFSLVLQLDSEAPEAPLRWRIDGWQQAAAHAATATPLQEAAAVVCEQYRCGFGRLLGMLDALDAVFAPKALGAPPR
ncbi:hypothetical protein EMIHUDRAFT_447678 [Emiliania huxleyi CCMP1516]|uniref:Uncharacterized protein n=2 Tax=Emiliania huxleyi TaxID=2903 RepID=A0A0D3JH23_EMIH1|nr:hypothetical protein EMIHUDRAFT_447678 [Emiliania huxleyi CCMP1516]EOD22808.1 hypothetical protein EMIHUDRAFT_447678 [Emiliania huxleyi CCMP1516]|eukprot:XP_005775237.1 hypothetical protein EMIHUDRAFT_447678 [Emiliania huxleyi CCMP1516]